MVTVSLLLDGRCLGLQRRLGPLAWLVLEHAALAAIGSGDDGGLWAPASVRSLSASLGVGRDSAARGLAVLVDAGVLVRSPGRRRPDGRFDRSGYWLFPPEGVTVLCAPVADDRVERMEGPVADSSASGRAEAGAAVTALERPRRVVCDPRPQGQGLPGTPVEVLAHRRVPARTALGQASLFDDAPVEEGSGLVDGLGTRPGGGELGGAVKPVGCEVDSEGHELAPVVPAGASPDGDPSRPQAIRGSGRC